MNGWRRACDVVFWVSLALWTSAIVAAGVSAAFVFGTLPDLGIVMDAYQAYRVEGDPRAHGRLAAGIILERVFTATDFAQVALGACVAATLAMQVLVFGASVRRPSNAVRCAAVAAALVIASLHVFLQAPAMNRELRAYWSAARSGDIPAAETHRLRFDKFHPRAELALQANAVLLLVAICCSAVALSPPGEPRRDAGAPDSLQSPALLRSRV